jgi:hypothetical protein
MTISVSGTTITEPTTIVPASISSAQTFYLASNSINYFTTAAAANWTVNLSYSSGTTLNTILNVGDTISSVALVLQGSTAYYQSANATIDGSSTGVTTYWQGGTAPSKGNASGVDVYTYTVIKTAATPTYTVLSSQTQF